MIEDDVKTTLARKIILKNDKNVDLVDNSLKQLNITNDPEVWNQDVTKFFDPEEHSKARHYQ